MAEPEADERTDQDPLLEFAIEPSKPEAAVVEADPPAQPVTVEAPDRHEQLARRVERLERSVGRVSRQVAILTTEVATLVNARQNKPRLVSRPANDRRRPRVAAVAATFAGAAAAAWFWIYPMGGAVPDASRVETPVAAAAEPEPPVAAPPPAPAPRPVAAPPSPVMRPARDVPARDASERDAPRRTNYIGTLSIDASPEAEVFINRRPAGRTPVRLTNLKAGSHLVWIQREGFRRFTRVVQVPADRVTRVSARLEQLGAQ